MSHPSPPPATAPWHGDVRIAAGRVQLDGTLDLPAHPLGLVLFAHGSGSSHRSPRNRRVAQRLQAGGLATLLFDLLTRDEEFEDEFSGELRFDIALLADRLRFASAWARQFDRTAALRLGYFGASTGAAAALVAATDPTLEIAAVVSRGGRPDLAGAALAHVQAPTLLIVGGADEPVIALNETAFRRLHCLKRIEIIPGATHLFEEPGTLDAAADLAQRWFAQHLPAQGWHP